VDRSTSFRLYFFFVSSDNIAAEQNIRKPKRKDRKEQGMATYELTAPVAA
jgi:hypothetical protein